ncbi:MULTISPECIES: CoA pyrophosphatase [unclassified Spirosoma]|uniref:NUDIX hydrolase n=1 Tax=unclassified Spirosoma TaxID=2621999 RepID=UPI0009619C66|nr:MULTISPECIES: CoA pyrophosphatase [unclassified Spirosoma]MBN8825292.1 CoA pyrophosphatase [Spirosoma sp.]OJW77534.1 MAG: coenzyme A pyrophosphatase [Spirosoma sp. 48-14]
MLQTSFNAFTENLRQRLQKPLPGEAAHQKMASAARYRLGIKPNERTRRSAVLICFYPFQNSIYLPLILRPQYDGVHAGQMAFPGGRMERFDENLTRTALRESQEEVGIRVSDVKVLGLLTELFIPPSNFYVQPVVGVLPYRPDFYPDPREVEAIVEVDLETLLDETIVGDSQIEVRGVLVDAPFYQIQGHRVWGATAMMISELLMLLDA